MVLHTSLVAEKINQLQLIQWEPANYYRLSILEGTQTNYPYIFDSVAKRTDSFINIISNLIADNAEQTALFNDLTPILKYRLNSYREGLDSAKIKVGWTAESKIKAMERGVSADSTFYIVNKLSQLKDNEYALLEKRTGDYEKTSTLVRYLTMFLWGVLITILLLGLKGINREILLTKKSNDDTRAFHDDLSLKIEELNKANSELHELRSYEKFTSTGRIARVIAHEVRNPLTTINLAVEELKEAVEPDNQFALDIITRNSEKINGLISNLLNATRHTELELENIKLKDLLDITLEMMKDRLDLRGMKLIKLYNDNNCEVKVDKEKMKIAILNICVNAIEAMEDGGTLTVETYQNKSKCTILISDNGKGMSEETAGKIFEAFYTGKAKGNGLGLTNTQNIILNHKGTIKVKSKEGEGTQFVILLNTA